MTLFPVDDFERANFAFLAPQISLNLSGYSAVAGPIERRQKA